MSESEQPSKSGSPFPRTSITLYQRVTSDNKEAAKLALEEFFKRYWYPLYAFLRARGTSHDDASDLVQGFVTQELLERDQIAQWKPELGKLRTFLKVAIDRFRKKEFRKDSAQKRGGNRSETHLPLDFETAEGRYEGAVIHHDSPDRIFERAWAEETVQQVLSTLASQYSRKDKLKEFRLLCRNLSSRAGEIDHIKYTEIASKLRTTENNVKQKMIAFRKEFKRVMETVVSETAVEGEVQDEVEFITNLVSGRLN